MPTHKIKGGYKWGKSGKVYPAKAQADKQGRAIYASGWRESIDNENINELITEITKIVINKIKKRGIQ